MSMGLTVVLSLVVVTGLMTGTRVAAQTETVLYNFTCCPRPGPSYQPRAGLVSDAAGNLYGTTVQGGAYGFGAVFELSPIAGGGWSEKVIYSFNEKPGQDDFGPESGLTLDAAGNLYGTKGTGGAFDLGMVFKLVPSGGGTWTLKVLHSFTGNDGGGPEAGVIFDGGGNLYGTTVGGGAYGRGAVFVLSPNPGGGWREKVLHSFRQVRPEGITPFAGLVFDAAGNLYGTTIGGGSSKTCQGGCGTVFKLSPVTGKGWRETVLHSFDDNGTDGALPYGGLIIDGAGNLYGTTFRGGNGRYGTVFEFSPVAGGGWTETILHNFSNNGTDGAEPEFGTLLLAGGNLYGSTPAGGPDGRGTVYKLSPAGGGGWTETILHTFEGDDGISPNGSLIMDSSGNLYGTTFSGGTAFGGGGTVFEIMP